MHLIYTKLIDPWTRWQCARPKLELSIYVIDALNSKATRWTPIAAVCFSSEIAKHRETTNRSLLLVDAVLRQTAVDKMLTTWELFLVEKEAFLWLPRAGIHLSATPLSCIKPWQKVLFFDIPGCQCEHCLNWFYIFNQYLIRGFL